MQESNTMQKALRIGATAFAVVAANREVTTRERQS